MSTTQVLAHHPVQVAWAGTALDGPHCMGASIIVEVFITVDGHANHSCCTSRCHNSA